MAKRLFKVFVVGVWEIHDMPGTWFDDDYRKLLAQREVEDVDDISGADLLDITLKALHDMELDDAADTVLAYKLPQGITAGSRHNIVQDLLDDQRPWEEAADIRLHARVFAAAVLLHKAFPASFSEPDMMQVTLEVTALSPEATEAFSRPPQAAFVARMLADAMDSHSILERLFDEQLASHSFPEAEDIIWLARFGESVTVDGATVELNLYSSIHWLSAMKTISGFESSAYDDCDAREVKHG